MAEMTLTEAVNQATEWADSGNAAALRALAQKLATEIDAGASQEGKPPPTAALAKELRETLERLEAMRDGDDAGADLAVVMSTPVWDTAGSGTGDARAARRKGRRSAG